MISNQILQNTIEGLKAYQELTYASWTSMEKYWHQLFLRTSDAYENAVLAFVASPADSQVIQGYQFFKIFDDHQLEYVLVLNTAGTTMYI